MNNPTQISMGDLAEIKIREILNQFQRFKRLNDNRKIQFKVATLGFGQMEVIHIGHDEDGLITFDGKIEGSTNEEISRYTHHVSQFERLDFLFTTLSDNPEDTRIGFNADH